MIILLTKLGSSNDCCPFKVVNVEGAGRGLVASRNIETKEVILINFPAVIGPQTGSGTICLNCFLKQSSSLTCPACSLPVCSPSCSNGKLHSIECQILGKLRKQVEPALWEKTLPAILASVTTLRLYSLKWR